jgi:hypothetical protein
MAATTAPSTPSFRSNAVLCRSLVTPRARQSSQRRSESAFAASTWVTDGCCMCQAYGEWCSRRCLKLHTGSGHRGFKSIHRRVCNRRQPARRPVHTIDVSDPVRKSQVVAFPKVDMHPRDSLSTPALQDVCPRCGTPGGAQSLLTSMTRYYVCRQCACRWQVDRAAERDNELTPDRVGAAD